ncbi:MAG: hypothetical protein AAB481_00490 [Patescibacteria group bacterium]
MVQSAENVGGATSVKNFRDFAIPVTIPEGFFLDEERDLWLDSRSKFLPKKHRKLSDSDGKRKYNPSERQENRFRRLEWNYWNATIVATIQEAALITQEISIESDASSLTALLFCGSNLFHFGVPFKSDIDVKLLVNGEPWEAISEFMRRYQEKFGDQGKTEWVNDFRYKFFPPFSDPNMFAIPKRNDLVLPTSYLDLGWNQDDVIGPITSEAGFFNTQIIEPVLSDPVEQIEKKIASNKGMNSHVGFVRWLGLHELAFSRPVFVHEGEEKFVQSLISRAKQALLSSD